MKYNPSNSTAMILFRAKAMMSLSLEKGFLWKMAHSHNHYLMCYKK